METTNATRRKLPVMLGAGLLDYQEKIILEHFIVDEENKTLSLIDHSNKVLEICENLDFLGSKTDFALTWTSVVDSRYYGIVKLIIKYDYKYILENPYGPYTPHNFPKKTLGFDFIITYFTEDDNSLYMLTNFKYTKETLELGIIENPDLKKAMIKNPHKNWISEVLNYGKFS